MAGCGTLTVISDRKRIALSVSAIEYIRMSGRVIEIHVSGGHIYETHTPLGELEQALGPGFIRIDRSCLVSAAAIHDITERVSLVSGETLEYSARRKAEIIRQFETERQRLIASFAQSGAPTSAEGYHLHYASFDAMPFAFADIEMVFSAGQRAVDWIFRYGNPALASLEKLPLEQLIGSSFRSLFSNMSDKWLRVYERVALFHETLDIIDYSPEIDTHLKITCFPTFEGHCGCILFPVDQVAYVSGGSRESVARYLRLL